MVDHGKVQSTIKPPEIKIDDHSVWLATNITEVKEEVGEEVFEGYEYDLIQYTKDEYILMQSESNEMLTSQLTDAEIALVELYEMIGG